VPRLAAERKANAKRTQSERKANAKRTQSFAFGSSHLLAAAAISICARLFPGGIGKCGFGAARQINDIASGRAVEES
jgi:hypothetical protein